MGLSVSEYLDRYESGCHENYVDWVWVDEGCRVTDAECGTVSDGQPGPWLLVQLVGDSAVWFYPDAAEVDDPAQPEDVVHGGWGLIPDAGFIRLDLYEDEVPEQDPGSDNSETYWESFDWEDYENGLSEEDEDTYWGWMSLYQDYDDEELAALVADCDAQEDPVAYWSKSCMAARKEQSDRMDSAEDGEEGFMDPIGMQDPCGPVGPALC